MQPPFSIGLLRFAKAEDERAAGTEWAKDHGHLSGNGPEALEMKGLTRPNQMVNDDVIICRLTYMKNHLFFLETFDNTVEHIVLLNSYLEEDLQTLKDLNIPPEEYQYGYYRKDSGEIYTYDVDPGTPVTIYDISQEYGAGEDRLYTFETWQEFVSAVQANEGLLVQPYTLTIQDSVVTKIAEKFYN